MNLPPYPKEENDDFLSSPANLEKFGYKIVCVECKKPLWHTRILKHDGAMPVSTETKSLSGHGVKFDRKIESCPLCKKKFFAIGKKGYHLYLVQDAKSGIRRLV